MYRENLAIPKMTDHLMGLVDDGVVDIGKEDEEQLIDFIKPIVRHLDSDSAYYLSNALSAFDEWVNPQTSYFSDLCRVLYDRQVRAELGCNKWVNSCYLERIKWWIHRMCKRSNQ